MYFHDYCKLTETQVPTVYIWHSKNVVPPVLMQDARVCLRVQGLRWRCSFLLYYLWLNVVNLFCRRPSGAVIGKRDLTVNFSQTFKLCWLCSVETEAPVTETAKFFFLSHCLLHRFIMTNKMWVFTIIIVHGPLNSQPLAQRRLLVTLCKYTWTQRCRKLFSGCHVIRVPNPRQNVSRHLLPASPPMLGAVQLKRNTSTSCPRCTCPPLKFSATCLPLSRDKHALLSGSGCHCGDGERLPLPAVHASSPGTEAAAVRWGGRAGPGVQVRGGDFKHCLNKTTKRGQSFSSFMSF